jgi:hypothetical protein
MGTKSLLDVMFDMDPAEPEGRRMLDRESAGGSHGSNYPGALPPRKSRAGIKYSGTENPGFNSSRPIARSNPDLGSCDIEEGCSFRVPMGDNSDPYSG